MSDEPRDEFPLWARLFFRYDRLLDVLFGVFFLLVGTALAVFWVVGLVWAVTHDRWLIFAELVGGAWLFGGAALIGWKWLAEKWRDAYRSD